ncbi:MAG TPA: hypothetical protein VFV66_36515 [Nonomuraea sp.]|nr:hypothetical protein [Nonomuraea sp.]
MPESRDEQAVGRFDVVGSVLAAPALAGPASAKPASASKVID